MAAITGREQLGRPIVTVTWSWKWQVLSCLAAALWGCAPAARHQAEDRARTPTYQKQSDGIIVTPRTGSARAVRLQLFSERIVRVTAVPVESLALPASLAVSAQPRADVEFKLSAGDEQVTLETAQLSARVSLENGTVSFRDASGTARLSERERGAFTPIEIEGQTFYRVHQVFNPGTTEAFYGLGQHQNAQLNYNGQDVELAQHNMDIAVPFVLSSQNYGLLWDTASITRFGDPRPYALASRDLKISDATGQPGGFTATYSIADAVKLARVEPDINYQFIKDKPGWPEPLLRPHSGGAGFPGIAAQQKVRWQGRIESARSGTHKFQLYASGYFKLYADDKLVLDGWRQNWNPWYHNFELPMSAGKGVAIRVEWVPDDGYIALLHNDPLPEAERHSLSLASEAVKAIDYYYIAGANADEVLAGYRTLTGKAVLLPRSAYGFWQSRQRYTTEQEVLGVVKEYRRRGLPLDNIVQDWFYWPEDAWGSHDFDATRFPHPKAMVDALHADNVQFTISVWAKFYPTTKNYQELDAKGFMYRRNVEVGAKDWVGPGYLSSHFDPYAQEARDIYWRQIEAKLKGVGVDGWWLDNTEPDIQSNLDRDELTRRIGPTALGPAAQYFNSYALEVTRAVYEGERRSSTPDKRVFILTRSGFAGLQRHAAATWSGDIAARWDDLYRQIAAGTNMSMSGLPNWTFDIGGFAVESRYLKPSAQDLEEWRELNLRWFQFGAFVPLFRSHGEAPLREIYNLAPSGSEVYESLAAHSRLRYRLLPYIYTLAGDTYHQDGTILRGLGMDFPDDARARDVNDQYLFGPSLLVSPVYRYHARSRRVYLPSGASWYDFYSGARLEGGREIEAQAPLARLPLFVKAGAILPIGPAVQHTAEKLDAPITLYVYRGASGSLSLYEDDGVSYGYERGAFSRTPIRYDDASGTLSIGARSGSFPGLVARRTFNVRWISPGEAEAGNLDAAPDASQDYSGQPIRFTAAQ
ncbi:MAG: TIM-barrel domain-containing protein [Deltaproteobacteria bacterium]